MEGGEVGAQRALGSPATQPGMWGCQRPSQKKNPTGGKEEGKRGQQTEAPWGAGEEEPCTMSPAPVVSSFDFDE